MPGVRKRGEEVRNFILENLANNSNIAALTAEKFGISLPAVYKHIDRLVLENQITKKSGRFVLQSRQTKYIYKIEKTLSEDVVWEKDIKKHFTNVPKNIWNIWVYGFLEMFNNAIDHSKGKKISVVISENRISTTMSVSDDGIGIFNNIKKGFNLLDEKDALLELAKGKRTTDISRHSGQGIFFTSKVFDDFFIKSNDLIYRANPEIINQTKTDRTHKGSSQGTKSSTFVYMSLANNSGKTLKDIFDKFSTEIPGDFDKTIIPIHLVNSTDLVARSQARRILSGLELFKEVILDFTDVEYIGQAFGDEIFRVFPNMNPNTKITAQNANKEVQYMINRAVNTKL
jgi:anti-sigma regulatory factor (Ser/Thr protein kinase)